MKRVWCLLIIIVIGLVACQEGEAEEEVRHIVLPMGFIPDPQYAPFYVADALGFYAEEDIEVEFDYSFETDGIALVGADETQFAIVGGDQVLLARAEGLPVVYVLEWYQRFPITIISRASENITEPTDLIGRNVGIPFFFGASYVGYIGLLSSNDIAQSDVSANEIGFNQVESLVTGQSEAVVGYANNEPIQLRGMGEDVNVMYVADYIDMVANGIVTNEETINNNPELVEGFVRATLRGLAETLEKPDEAFEISKDYVEELDPRRKRILESSLSMWRAETLGIMTPDSWVQTQDILLEMNLLDEPLEDLEEAYTNEYVLEVQDDDDE